MNKEELKDNMIKGLKETIYPKTLFGCINNIDVRPPSNCGNEVIISRQFSKSIKQFVEDSLSTEIEGKINEIKNYGQRSEEMANISHAFRVTEGLLEQSKICIQDNLANTLDSCIKELDHLKFLNDSDLDISPLLHPEHIRDVAECLSCENPLDVKMNALQILLKSHMAEAVNAEGWIFLRKKLVDNLCDSNNEIFDTCLKIHVKLATSLLPEAIKECTLNLLESLGQYYYLQQGDSKTISLQNMYFFRMVHITILLLQTFKESTVNVARFGENRFAQMIDNLVQLLSTHDSRQLRNNFLTSPLEVISNLDPECRWLSSLTHFAVLRKLLYSSLHKNIGFVQVIVEIINNWISEPFFPNKNSSKILQGEISIPVQKYSLFIHCFSMFITITPFCIRSSLFPIKLYNNEDLFTVEVILKKIITLINDTKFGTILQKKSTEMFKVCLAKNVSSLLCLKGINGACYLTLLLNFNDNRKPLDNKIIVKILEYVSQHEQSDNPFIHTDVLLKRNSALLRCFPSNDDDYHPITKRRHEFERQSSINSLCDGGSSGVVPFEIYLKYFIERINNNTADEQLPTLFQITNTMFCHFEAILGINNKIKLQTIEIVAEMYNRILEKIKQPKTELINLSLHRNCLHFLLKVGVSTFGFSNLQRLGVHDKILMDGLNDPSIDWTDALWIIFVCNALMTMEGYEILSVKRAEIFRLELNKLWNTVEENCTGSEFPVEDKSKLLFRLTGIFSLDVKGVKALLLESSNGSDITLMDECEIRPSNIYDLLQNYALNTGNCPNYFYHQFALTVLYILSSNLDASLFLQHKLNYQEALLQLQADNRVDEFSEVIIDECSILRHKIIEQSYLPGRVRCNTRPTHLAPRPESTLARVKTRFRGNGELARWLTETRLGLHDNNWLKHARKLHRNSYADEIKGSTILELLEQVVKVLPGIRPNANWQNCAEEQFVLTPEELLAVELVIRYGVQHRLVQSTQQNIDNLGQLILSTKRFLNKECSDYFGFDWFVASAYLTCSGNIEKTQIFLKLILTLPTAQFLWLHLAEADTLSQLGNILENIIAEELPVVFQLLQNVGLSWWQLCCSWLRHCWWNVMDWSQISHWLTMSILHQADHTIYLCVALLHCNQERLFEMKHQDLIYEILLNPVDKFQLVDAKVLIDKLHKKYHSTLPHNLAMIFGY